MAQDIKQYIDRERKAAGIEEDDEESDEEEDAVAKPWLFSKEGSYAHVEEWVEARLQPLLSLIQNDEGFPTPKTKGLLISGTAFTALAASVKDPNSFASYCMTLFFQKTLKPINKDACVLLRYGTHIGIISATAALDFSSAAQVCSLITDSPCQFFGPSIAMSTGLLACDAKKFMKGAKNHFQLLPTTCKVEEVKEKEIATEPKKVKKQKFKGTAFKVAKVGATVLMIGAVGAAYWYDPKSTVALIATDFIFKAMKPIMKECPLSLRYAAFGGLAAGGYALQMHYPQVPVTAFALNLAMKSASADAGNYLSGNEKRVAPLFPSLDGIQKKIGNLWSSFLRRLRCCAPPLDEEIELMDV